MLQSRVFFILYPHQLPPLSPLFPYTTLFRSFVSDPGLPPCDEIFAAAVRGRPLKLGIGKRGKVRSEEHTSELQSRFDLVCILLLDTKKFGSSVAISTFFIWLSVIDSANEMLY